MATGFWQSDDDYKQSGGLLWGQQQLQQLGQDVQTRAQTGQDWANQQIQSLMANVPAPLGGAAQQPVAQPQPAAVAPPAAQPPATAQDLGQQWADQQINNLQTQAQAPAPTADLGGYSSGIQQALSDVPAEAQGVARQTLGLPAQPPPPEPQPQAQPLVQHEPSPPGQSETRPGMLATSAPNASGQVFPLPIKPDNEPHSTYHSAGGTDLMAPRGTPVASMQSGTVTEVYTDKGDHQLGGNAVLVHGNDGLDYYYAHFDQPTTLRIGDQVQAGQQIGQVGNSGNAWKGGQGAPHLHLGIGHGISSGVGAEGGLGQNYNAQDVVAQLQSTLGQGGTQTTAGVGAARPLSYSPATQTTAGLSGGGAQSNAVGDRGQQIMAGGAQAASWLGTQGQQALQAVLLTEGGLNNARGDNGASAGPLQFFSGGPSRPGQLDQFASAMGMGIEQAKQWVEQNPVEAIKWAIGTPDRPGYLGAAIQKGIQQGLSGPDLATYAQRFGQVSVSPERAGQNWQSLFGNGQQLVGGAFSGITQGVQDTTSSAIQRGQELINQGQQMVTQGQNLLGQTGTGAQRAFQSLPDIGQQILSQAPKPLTDTGNALVQQAQGLGQQMIQPIQQSQFYRNITGTNPDQAALDQAYQQRAADVNATLGNVRLPTNPLEAAGMAGLGAPTGGEISMARQNEAIMQANPLRDVPFVGGATTLAAQTFADPTNWLLAGGPTLPRAAGEVLGSQAVQSALRSRLPAEAEAGFAAGLPTFGREPPGPTNIYGPTGEVISRVEPSAGLVPGVPGLPSELAGASQDVQRAVNINLARFNIPEEARNVISGMAEALPETMDAARRGVIADEAVRQMSQNTGIDLTKIVQQWAPGQAFNAETLLAIGDSLAASAMRVVDAQQMLRENPSSVVARANMMDELVRHGAVQEVMTGATAEAGRALRVLAQPVEGSRFAVQQMTDMARDAGMTTDELVDAMTRADLTDPRRTAELARTLPLLRNTEIGEPPAAIRDWLFGGAERAAAPEGLVGLEQPALGLTGPEAEFQRGLVERAGAPVDIRNLPTGPADIAQMGRQFEAAPLIRAGQELAQRPFEAVRPELFGGPAREAQDLLRTQNLPLLPGQELQPGLVQRAGTPADVAGLMRGTAAEALAGRQLEALPLLRAGREVEGQPFQREIPGVPGLFAREGEPVAQGMPRIVGNGTGTDGAPIWQQQMANMADANGVRFGDVFKLYHTGSVISGFQTLGKVAMNAIAAPLWNLFTHGLYDLATFNPSRMQGSLVAALGTFAELPANFMRGFLGVYQRPTSVGAQLMAADRPLASTLARIFETPSALHAGLQEITRTTISRFELGRLAGQEATREGRTGYDWFNRVQDLLDNPKQSWLQTAEGVGKRAALQGDLGWFGQNMERMIAGLEKNWLTGAVARTIWPVFKIGMNSLTQRTEQSPFGLFGTIFDVARGLAGHGPYAGAEAGQILPTLLGREAPTPGLGAAAGRPFEYPTQGVTPLRERFINNFFGTSISTFLAMKGLDGAVTGSGPDDPEQRRMLEGQGWQPKSLHIGDNYYNYEHLPGAEALAIVGEYGDAVNYPTAQEAIDVRRGYDAMGRPVFGVPGTSSRVDLAAQRLVLHTGENMLSQAGLMSLGQILDAFSGSGGDIGRTATTTAGQTASTFTPMYGAVRSVAQMTDPYQRKPVPGEFLQQIEQNVPGLRQLVPERLSPTGEALPNPMQGLGAFAPMRIGVGVADPTLAALAKVGVSIGPPPPTIGYGRGQEIQLRPAEQQAFTRAEGELIRQIMQPMIASGDWQRMDPASQRATWQQIAPEVRKYATGMLLGQMDATDALRRVQPASGNYLEPVVGYEPTDLAEQYMMQEALARRQAQHAAFLRAMGQSGVPA